MALGGCGDFPQPYEAFRPRFPGVQPLFSLKRQWLWDKPSAKANVSLDGPTIARRAARPGRQAGVLEQAAA
jgi:hypothetical protein